MMFSNCIVFTVKEFFDHAKEEFNLKWDMSSKVKTVSTYFTQLFFVSLKLF